MKNIISYAKQFKDTSYDQMAFSEVDGLVLSQISYYDFDLKGLDYSGFHHTVAEYMDQDADKLIRYLLSVNGDEILIEHLRKGGRHGGLKVAYYIEETDVERDQQFAAITFKIREDEYFIAFRGTDNSVVGWKEDFNMSYQSEIPAQKKAVKYTIDIMERHTGRFYLGGHSKGGNLSVYTAMMLPEHLQNRVGCIYNYDGPGFLDSVYQSENYKKIHSLIKKIVPHTSIVGMMLEVDHNYAVIKSSAVGMLQHNPFNWIVEENCFVFVEDVDEVSNILRGTMNRWMLAMKVEEREQFVNTVFEIISSTGIVHFKENKGDRKEKSRMLLEHLKHVEPEEIKMIFSIIGRFIQSSAREIRHQAKGKKIDVKNPFHKKKYFRL